MVRTRTCPITGEKLHYSGMGRPRVYAVGAKRKRPYQPTEAEEAILAQAQEILRAAFSNKIVQAAKEIRERAKIYSRLATPTQPYTRAGATKVDKRRKRKLTPAMDQPSRYW